MNLILYTTFELNNATFKVYRSERLKEGVFRVYCDGFMVMDIYQEESGEWWDVMEGSTPASRELGAMIEKKMD